jgi:hypothetical protein
LIRPNNKHEIGFQIISRPVAGARQSGGNASAGKGAARKRAALGGPFVSPRQDGPPIRRPRPSCRRAPSARPRRPSDAPPRG